MVVIVAALLGFARPVLADTYTIVDLGDDSGRGIYGIDTAGDVVIWGSSGCGISSPICYVTYVNGVAISDSLTAPTLLYDNGTSCSSTPAGFNTSKTVCNGEWTGLGSLYNPNGDPNGVYIGSGSVLDFLNGGSADQVFLNSSGDFAWTDGQDDEMYEAIAISPPVFDEADASFYENSPPAETPEPGSLLLVGTGLVWLTTTVRRKNAK